MIPFTPPTYKATAFNCPRCQAYSTQRWSEIYTGTGGPAAQIPSAEVAYCTHCKGFSFWIAGRLIEPEPTLAPPAHPDFPDDVEADYREAASIATRSPRGAAALLRLAIQKFCRHLGKSGKNINSDIASLVSEGMPDRIQKALDVLRVVGNEAVHPGELDLRDDLPTALGLFHLINIIVDNRISEPKRIDEMYSRLPESKRLAIDARDQRALGAPEQPAE